MSTETYGVTIESLDGQRAVIRIVNTYGDWVGIPPGADLVVRALFPPGTGPGWLDGIRWTPALVSRVPELVDRMELVSTRNYPGVLEHTFIYSDSQGFDGFDGLPQLLFAVQFSAGVALDHLQAGLHVASRAYSDGNIREGVHTVDPYAVFAGVHDWGRQPGGVARLTDWLGSRTTFLAWRSAEALGNLGPDAVDAVPALMRATLDPDLDVAGYSVAALGRIGDLQAVDVLVPLLGWAHPIVVQNAALSLAWLAPRCGRAEDALARIASAMPVFPLHKGGVVRAVPPREDHVLLANAALHRITGERRFLDAWLAALEVGGEDAQLYSRDVLEPLSSTEREALAEVVEALAAAG